MKVSLGGSVEAKREGEDQGSRHWVGAVDTIFFTFYSLHSQAKVARKVECNL